MLYFFSYRDVKAMTKERRTRSLQRMAASGALPLDGYRRPEPEPDAEVVELVFSTACETDRIGA